MWTINEAVIPYAYVALLSCNDFQLWYLAATLQTLGMFATGHY